MGNEDDFKDSNDCSYITEAIPLYYMNGIPVGIFRFLSALLYLFFSFGIIYMIKKEERNAKEKSLYQLNEEDYEAVQSGNFIYIIIQLIKDNIT